MKTNKIFDLSELGLLKVGGQGALQLLQGQLSCDMAAIDPHNGAMGVHCNPQGRIISLFYAVKIHDDFYLIMPRPLLETALTALKKYAPFFKATLENASSSYQLAGAFADAEMPCAAQVYLPEFTGRKIMVLPASSQVSLSPLAEWKYLDMHDGIPAIYPETSGKFLPHDLNLQDMNAVSFTKGCFTGQEIIARMHYRGKPKNHLYRGLSSTPLMPGDELFLDNKPAAAVIDCCQNVYNERYAMLFTADEITAANTQLSTMQGNLIEPTK